jgi:excisionase family DNA binding protein
VTVDLMDATDGHPVERAFTPANRRQLLRHLLDLEAQRFEGAVTGDPSSPPRRPQINQPAPAIPSTPGDVMTQTDRPTLSMAETASLLGISRWLVQQAVHDGSLPSVRVGRRILIPRSRLLAWLDGMDGPASDVCAPADNAPEPSVPRPRRMKLG